MKTFENPQIEVVTLAVEEVITTSNMCDNDTPIVPGGRG